MTKGIGFSVPMPLIAHECVGLDYIHGFSLTDRLPLFLETGVNLNFNFGSKDAVSADVSDYEDFDDEDWDDFMDDMEDGDYDYEGYAYDYGYDDDYDYDDNDGSKWISNFDKKQVGKNNTWNRFQMGWHVGVGFQYKPFYLGVQNGTDFIAAYSYKKRKISSGNLKISLAYCF